MSDKDLQSVASASGTYPALQPRTAEGRPAGNATTASGKELPASAVTRPDLEALAVKLNMQSRSIGRDLRFKVDLENGQSVIQVLDRDTGEVIRVIPPEKAEISLSVNGEIQLRLFNDRA